MTKKKTTKKPAPKKPESKLCMAHAYIKNGFKGGEISRQYTLGTNIFVTEFKDGSVLRNYASIRDEMSYKVKICMCKADKNHKK